MPSIVSRPTAVRATTRGLSKETTEEYIKLMNDAEEGQMVEVDDSDRDSREKAYVRGERVRIAANKYGLMPEGKTIGIFAFEADETEDGKVYRAGVYLKDAPKPTAATKSSDNGGESKDEASKDEDAPKASAKR